MYVNIYEKFLQPRIAIWCAPKAFLLQFVWHRQDRLQKLKAAPVMPLSESMAIVDGKIGWCSLRGKHA